MNPSLLAAVRELNAHDVEFIVIGGWAAVLHGSARVTYDVDVVYSRSPANIANLVASLKGRNPYLRGVPAGLPFFWDERTIRNGLNFTLTTQLGDLDLLGEAAGGGTYELLLPHSIEVELEDQRCRFVTLPKLIDLKRAAGRPKDLETIAELELLREQNEP